MIRCRRVYDPPGPGDGHRVLADRLWPRGISREKAAIDAWEKAITPSHELRKWYGHAPERWPEFRTRFLKELDAPEAEAALKRLRTIASDGTLTLLTAARNETETHLTVLAELMEKG